MTNVETILHQFTQICSASSTDAIRDAEAKLADLEKDQNFLVCCGAILVEPQVQYVIKKLIAVYFDKYSKRVCKQKNTTKTASTVQFYLALLQNHSIDFDLKPFINVALQYTINLESNRGMKIDIGSRLIGELKLSIDQPDESINFTYLIFCGKAILGAHNYNEETRDFTKSTFREYLHLNIKLLGMAQRYTLENKDSLSLIYKLLREYSFLLKSFLKRLGVLDIDATKLLYLQELQSCLTTAIALNIKENSIPNSIFILVPAEIELSRVINEAKANYFNALTSFTRLINTYVKHANLVNSNPLYSKLAQLIEYFFKSTSSLLEISPYYSLPPRSGILETLDELFSFYVNCLRINDFYVLFGQNKTDLIQKILLPCISLTPYEASNFYDDPDEFRQFSFQIVERNLKTMSYMQQQKEDEQDPIKQYETLKTLASEFLSSLCKFQDGTLTQIIEHALNVIENKINSIFSKSTMYLVIASLKDHLKERKDLKTKIAQLLLLLLEGLPIPVVEERKRKDEDIQYAYLWLALSKLLLGLKDIYPQIIPISFKVGIAILQSNSTSQVHKDFVLDMFDDLMRIDEGQRYLFDIVAIYNHLLAHSSELFSHLLDSYFDLIKYNSDVLKKNPVPILEGLRLISKHIEIEVQKQDPVQMIINKCWNVIREVGQNSDFIPELIPNIEEIVLPLVPYIDGVRNLDFEEDILLLITSFVEKGKKVTENQQRMFEIIPKIFYGQYNCRFGQAFHTIQLFTYYGSDILKKSFNAIQAIVKMSITSITQSEYKKKPIGENQNCEGVLTLQTLVSKCGDVFTLQLWSSIIKAILSRLQRETRYRFLSANLYALLAMCLVHCHKFFSDEESQVLMTRVLSNINVFNNIQYAPKVLITAFTELLLLYEVPFVKRRFVQILDLTITLLEFLASKKEGYFGQEEDDTEQAEYSNSLILLKNDMKLLDQFNYFKRKVEHLKQINRELLVSSVGQLPQAKKDYLINVLTIEKVANVPRKIFKIKK